MKKRNILFLGLVSIMVFIGLRNVDAKTIYTAYSAGDKITVNVNDSTKLNFYVVSDSSAESSTVEAIMDGTSYPTKTTYDNINSTLSSYTGGWTNITNVSIPSMYKLIEIDASTLSESGKFTSPTYAITVSSYWLSDSGRINDVDGHWVLGSDLSNEGTYGVYDDSQEIAIRPLINVSKENVVGGASISEDEILWNKFVENFKKTDLVKTMEKPESNSLDITSTSDSLKIVLNDGTNTWTTNFTYADNVITYVPSSNEDSIMAANSIWISNCLYTLSILKGYDLEKVDNWLSEDRKFTLANDGIEFEIKEFNIEDDSSESNVSISGIAYSSFKLDIKNGLKTFSNKVEEDKKDEVVENPKTGDATRYIILGLGASLVIGTIVYMKSRKYSKFPQA